MNIAIIPARGGSKRIPRKNIRSFCGRPMIKFAIEAGLKCGEIDHVIVSTEDDEIARLAQGFGADVPFRRPKTLADDSTPTIPVIQHAIDECQRLGIRPENVCCIYPCVPFIRATDLGKALALLTAKNQRGYTFPVAQFPAPIQRALRRKEDHTVSPFMASNVETRTQDLEPAFFDAGQFYWARTTTWIAGDAAYTNGSTIVLPEWRVVDIDTPEDWERAELLFQALTKKGAVR
ncbi:MAG: pseudaminic acid cytidylyltransferase [Pseudomonadota bacterium]